MAAFYNRAVEILRTPEERFASLPGWPWAPRWIEIAGLRLHLVDEGPRDAPVFLCLHGQPTWCYLYRHMAPVFLAAGGRVVMPDLAGFGRSDKPADEPAYSFDFHRGLLLELVARLDLRRITLVVQDWGGLLGLTLPPAAPERYSRLLVMNTALGTGDAPLGEGFLAWRDYSNRHPDLDCGRLLARACPSLTAAEAAAYDAPFPDARYKAGVRRFPNLVPDRPEAPGAAVSRAARDWWREQWRGESFMAIGMRDPVLGPPAMRALHGQIRGCPPPLEHPEAGHFVPEWGAEIARAALRHWGLAA